MIGKTNGGSGGTGATLTVTAPALCTVSISKDGKTKTKTAGADGTAVFKGLGTGTWTVNMTDGVQTAPTRTAYIIADYAITTSFFAATIHITYPAGSTCTATDGVTSLTAPDTSGTWDCVVPNAGDWTVALDSGFSEVVNGIIDGGSYTVDKWYLYNLGEEHVAITGGWVPVKGLSSYWEGGYVVVKGADHFECNATSGNYTYSYLATSAPIDLTTINEICINVLSATASGSTYHHRRISIANGNSYEEMHTKCVASTEFRTGTTGMVRLDVSKITGRYFIGVGAEYEGHSVGSLKVSGVWLR